MGVTLPSLGRFSLALPLIAALLYGTAGPLHAAPSPEHLLEQIESADPSLQTYRASVEFELGLTSFPYVRKTVHGEAYFKRPGRMQIVFSDLPAIAQRFRQLYVGLGTPEDWRKKFDIRAEEQTAGEPASAYLILTPKVHDRRLKEVDIFIDPATSLPTHFVWRYADGIIEMRQQLGEVEGHPVIATQKTEIRLPGVRAFVNTKLTNVQINPQFEDSVFTGPTAR